MADLLASPYEVLGLYATEVWTPPRDLTVPVQRIEENELQRLTALEHAQHVLAVARIPEASEPLPLKGRILALDGIRDPGNLGTILRLADWFGLDAVVCGNDCVDRFNPKVVQASMGSLFRICAREVDLPKWLENLPLSFWKGGTFMEGTNIYRAVFPEEGVLVLGNEGSGIRMETGGILNHRIHIPGLGDAESLNVAAAAAVCCSEWSRSRLVHL